MKRAALSILAILSTGLPAFATGCWKAADAGSGSDTEPDAECSWTVVDPEVDLFDVWGSGPDDVFAVGSGAGPGNSGRILHWDGSSLEEVWGTGDATGYSTLRLNGVWGASSDDVFAVGMDVTFGSIVLHFNGSSWISIGWISDIWLEAIWGSSGSDVYAVGHAYLYSKAVVYHYDGAEWTLAHEDADFGTFFEVWGRAADDMYLLGGSSTDVRVVHYDGESWQEIPVQPPLRLWNLGGDGAGGLYGTCCYETGIWAICHFDGSSWELDYTAPDDVSLNHVLALAPDRVFAVGGTHHEEHPWGVGAIAHFDGSGWTADPFGAPEVEGSYRRIWARSPADVFLIGAKHLYADGFFVHMECPDL